MRRTNRCRAAYMCWADTCRMSRSRTDKACTGCRLGRCSFVCLPRWCCSCCRFLLCREYDGAPLFINLPDTEISEPTKLKGTQLKWIASLSGFLTLAQVRTD